MSYTAVQATEGSSPVEKYNFINAYVSILLCIIGITLCFGQLGGSSLQ